MLKQLILFSTLLLPQSLVYDAGSIAQAVATFNDIEQDASEADSDVQEINVASGVTETSARLILSRAKLVSPSNEASLEDL